MKTSSRYYFEDLSDVFQFGKHQGVPLSMVISADASYIYWCANNIPDFRISENALKQLRKFHPSFIVTEILGQHVGDPYVKEYDDEDWDDDWDNNAPDWYDEEESPTYERYGGSYAQDVMGYSDDDIDTIFDGDPLAYWNID